MKIGILGTGMVGNTLGTALITKGHEIKMGSRDAANEKAAEWTKGGHSVEAINSAGEQNLAGKILVDVANPA